MRLHKRLNMMTTKRLYLLLLGFALIGMKAQAQHVSFGPLHSRIVRGKTGCCQAIRYIETERP